MLGAVTVASVLALYRPLLLSSISPELAAARGIPTRTIGSIFLLVLAIAAALAAITIGSILATALRVTRSPGRAMLSATVLGWAITWISLLLAYDSYDWSSSGTGWPVSFFVVTLVLIVYVLSGLPGVARSRRGSRSPSGGRRPSRLAIR